jgi:hypothetical protein
VSTVLRSSIANKRDVEGAGAKPGAAMVVTGMLLR